MIDHANAAIEFHDSKLGEVVRESDSIVVRLAPAYVHRSAGEPGTDDGVGGLQACALVFDDGRVEGDPGELPADVWAGNLRIAGEDHAELLSLSFEALGTPVELDLSLFDGRRVIVSGAGPRVRTEGEFKEIERFKAG